MQAIHEIFIPFYAWFFFVFIGLICVKLFSWAKNKKTGALVFGVLVQMFSPDPFVERTVKVVQEDKKQTNKQQDENGDPDNKEI